MWPTLRVEFEIEVGRAIEEVFAYLTDLSKLAEWDPRVVSVELETDLPMSVGTRMRETRSLLGRTVEQLVEVSEHEPPRLFSLRILEGPVPLDGRNVLEPIDGGTRIRFRGEGELRGAAKLLQPLMRVAVERQLRRHYQRLRENLESR
jgi:carbon monoxide dehydrogenase subunit G